MSASTVFDPRLSVQHQLRLVAACTLVVSADLEMSVRALLAGGASLDSTDLAASVVEAKERLVLAEQALSALE